MAAAKNTSFEEILGEEYRESELGELEERFSGLFDSYFLDEVKDEESFDPEYLESLEANPGYDTDELAAMIEAACRTRHDIEKTGEGVYRRIELGPEDYIKMREDLRQEGNVLSDDDKLRWALPRYAYDKGILDEGVYDRNEVQRRVSKAMSDFGDDVAPTRVSTRVNKIASISEDMVGEDINGFRLEIDDDSAQDIYRVVELEE